MTAGRPGPLRGTGVSPGVGIGPVRSLTGRGLCPPGDGPPEGERRSGEPVGSGERGSGSGEPASRSGDVDDERARARGALEAVGADLEERAAGIGGQAGEMLGAQAMMARDPAVASLVDRRIGEGMTAAQAVREAFGTFRETLDGAGGYLAARVADLDGVRDRVIALIENRTTPGVPDSDEPFVLVARDLSPADTALLDPAKVVAFVTEEGGPTSHTAILARAAGVPAVAACAGCTALPDGTLVLVDGTTGDVLPNPPKEDLARSAGVGDGGAGDVLSGPSEEGLVRSAGVGGRGAVRPAGTWLPDAGVGAVGRGRVEAGVTADGYAVPLLANLGGPAEVAAAAANGAEGVGLYRTELLFLGRAQVPSVQEQEAAYRAVLEAFPRVTLRVLDAGADKPLGFLPALEAEANPALGVRGLRLLRRYPDVLRAQLRALARAASGLDVRLEVMAPMIASAEEARFFAAACHEAGIPRAGVMIEVPAAALRARDLAAEVDFFSLGTNDLAQYAFAADRQIGALGGLNDPWQPALLDLAAFAAHAAAAAGKPCGVCGEAAGDPALACALTGLGVTSLSMSPHALPAVRAALAAHTQEQCVRAAAAARDAPDAGEARRAARAELPHLPHLPHLAR